MKNIVKILLFVIVNGLGSQATPILANVAVMLDAVPKFSSELAASRFQDLFFGGGTWAWIAAAVISIGYFFVKSAEWRMVLILAPLFAPIIYCVGLLLYYKFA